MHHDISKRKQPLPETQLVATEPGASLGDLLLQLDAHVGKVYDALTAGSLLLVCTGPGDTTQQRCMEVGQSLPSSDTWIMKYKQHTPMLLYGTVQDQHTRDMLNSIVFIQWCMPSGLKAMTLFLWVEDICFVGFLYMNGQLHKGLLHVGC